MLNVLIASFLASIHASGLVRETPIERSLLVTVGRAQAGGTPSYAYLVASEGILATPQPSVGTFAGIDWGTHPGEVLVSAFETEPSPRNHVEVLRMDGRFQRTYPSLPVKEFIEADGRLTPGGAMGPARISADGKFVALAANGRALAILDKASGAWVLEVSKQANGFDWSPTGHTLAYTRPVQPGDLAASTSQLFLLDVDSRKEWQLTHLATTSSAHGSMERRPLVTGVSWARRANLIAFYNAPNRGIHVWSPDGKEVAFVNSLRGECWRKTQISAAGDQIFYLSSSVPKLCALNGGNEIRSVNVDGSNDRVIVRAEPDNVIYDFDLWPD